MGYLQNPVRWGHHSGWWWLEHELYVSICWEFHHPNWPIFFRGVETTNQHFLPSLIAISGISVAYPTQIAQGMRWTAACLLHFPAARIVRRPKWRTSMASWIWMENHRKMVVSWDFPWDLMRFTFWSTNNWLSNPLGKNHFQRSSSERDWI